MFSLKKKRKTPVQKKKTKNNETWKTVYLYTISLFLFSSFVPMDCIFGICFSFAIFFFFEYVFCWGYLFQFWDFVFLFSGSVFLFRVSHFVLCVSVLGLFFPIFVVVVVLWFFCFYRPPYIFDSPLHLNPTTGEHFKTPLKISSQISNRSGKK